MKRLFAVFLGVTLDAISHAQSLLPCQLSNDRWLIYNPYTACLTGYMELSERVLAQEGATRTEGGYLGQLYGAVGLGHWFSMHARGAFKELADPNQLEILSYARTQHAFLQLGHPVTDAFYASIGRIDGPFGLNHDLFDLSLPSRARSLWINSVTGGRIGVGRRDGLRLEAGTSNLDQVDPSSGDELKLLSSRLIKGIDLLNGTRLIASYATSSNYQQRRMGLATLVHNDRNRTSLEWVRQTDTSTVVDFKQVFRLVHEQQEESWAWVMAMEEQRRDSYRLSLGTNRNWRYSLIGSLSAHYQRQAMEPRDHFIIMAGIGIGKAWVWEESSP